MSNQQFGSNKQATNALSGLFDANEQKAIIEASYATIHDGAVGRYNCPNMGIYIPGQYYEAASCATALSSTYVGTTNTLELVPFVSPNELVVDQIGVATTSGVAATQARVLVYDDGDRGLPRNLVFNGSVLDTTSGPVYLPSTSGFTFTGGRLYWIGVHCSGAPSLVGARDFTTTSFGLVSATGLPATVLRRTVAFGSAPSIWGYTTSDLAAALTVPSVRFRVK